MADELSEEDLMNLKTSFDLYSEAPADDDGSGSGPTVSHDNLWRVLRSLGYKPTAREFEDMVLGMDRAKTGGIIFADFVLGMGAYMRPVDDAGALRDVFRKITHARVSGDDAQPRSYFDADDLAQVMSNLGLDTLSHNDVLDLVMAMDSSGEMKINLKMFLLAMGSERTAAILG